jgi:hypothetical protein
MQNPQGPFYPGQMMDWYRGGFFSQDHPVAPSFNGEFPQKYARIVEAFPQPIIETAFVPGAPAFLTAMDCGSHWFAGS